MRDCTRREFLRLAGLAAAGVSRAASGCSSQRAADLMSICRPTFTVVDAVRVLAADGPTGGDLNDVERLDTVPASGNIVAADAHAATLFGQTGADIPHAQAAHEMDLEKVTVREAAA